MNTVSDFEMQMIDAINAAAGLLPEGLEVVSAEVLNGDDRKQARKKKGNASVLNLGVGDSIYLRLGSTREPAARESKPSAGPPPDEATGEVEDLLRALDRAEREPGHSFVALKWFRDVFLLRGKLAWAAALERRHKALSEAIACGWILRDRLANPKNPQYPTTALRVNRNHPEVRRVLGQAETLGWGFTPVEVPGEPASEILMRERGRY